MKALIINGSPKGGASNTLVIANAFAEGFPKGTEVSTVTLKGMNIKPCAGCFSCWTKTPGECIIKDDMAKIYEEIKSADIIIESFPLFFFGLPSMMKAMTDRCLPFTQAYAGNVAAGGGSFHEIRDPKMEEKKLVVISTCGYVEPTAMYPALEKEYDLIAGKGHYTKIFCPEGELFNAESCKKQVGAYLAYIKQAGHELAAFGKISEETMAQVNRPILSPKAFEMITQKHWSNLSK